MHLLVVLLTLPLLVLSAPVSRQFSADDLQPSVPSTPLLSTNTIRTEFDSWASISEIYGWYTNQIWNTSIPLPESLTIFASTNTAIRKFAKRLIVDEPSQPDHAVATTLFFALIRLSQQHPDFPKIADILRYHTLSDNLSEAQLKQNGTVTPLFGPAIDVSNYPLAVIDEDPKENATRLGRQIRTANNDRLIIIDSFLLPLDLDKFIAENNISLPLSPFNNLQAITIPTEGPTTPLFPPLLSVNAVVDERRDASIFCLLLNSSDITLSHPPKHHLFIPSNLAIYKFATDVVGFRNNITDSFDPIIGKNINETRLLVDGIRKAWKLAEALGVVPLDDLLRYHIVETDQSYEQLSGDGPLKTLFDNNTITITDGGVKDLDDARGDAKGVISIASQTGYVTIIESFLYSKLSGSLPSPKPTIEPRDEPTPSSTKAPTTTTTPAAEVTPTDEPSPSSTKAPTTTTVPAAEVTPTDKPTPPSTTAPTSTSTTTVAVTPTVTPEEDGVCFPTDAVVRTKDSAMRLEDLQSGTEIVVDHDVENGDETHSAVFLWTHRQPDILYDFLNITTRSGHSIALTKSHYLYANGRLTAAESVRIGDRLRTSSGISSVRRITKVKMRGLYAPHTLHGDLVVNGIVVSGYSKTVHPTLAHALLVPLRLFVRVSGAQEVLTGMFDHGAPRLARFVPGGRNVH